MKNAIRNVAVPVLLTFAMLTSAAWAQQTATTSDASSSTAPAAAKNHSQKRADAVEQRISDMHTQLKITDMQSKPWNAFAQTMRDNAKNTAQAFQDRAQKLSSMNADEAMKSYAQLAQNHADNMKKLSSAWSDLYAVFSADQKQIADDMYRNQGAKRHSAPRKHKASAPASAASSG
jgi:glucose dehydrogenase